MKYLVEVEYPHKWSNGFTLHCPDLEEARAAAERYAAQSSPSGTENYIKVTIWKFEEAVN